jgi:uncharacterized membrane protein YbhN (UPF0104 family)
VLNSDVQRPGRRHAATAGLLAALGLALVLGVPGLRPVIGEISRMNPAWVAIAAAFELASCLSFVVLFRLFFDRLPAPEGRALAWTTMASGALFPGGGVGGLAIGGWLMHLAGAPTEWILRRSSAIFLRTTAASGAAIVLASTLLLAGAPGPHDFLRADLPLLASVAITLLVLAAPRLVTRRAPDAATVRTAILVAGLRDAQRIARQMHWRNAGAIGYLAFDIAVLWATFQAAGDPPTFVALTLGYTIGYLANALPIPGGIGILDAGLVGALVFYGASPLHASAAVLVYHAIAVWTPSLGGVIGYAWLRRRLIDTAERG